MLGNGPSKSNILLRLSFLHHWCLSMGICLKRVLLNDRKGSGQILKGEKLRGGRKGAGNMQAEFR